MRTKTLLLAALACTGMSVSSCQNHSSEKAEVVEERLVGGAAAAAAPIELNAFSQSPEFPDAQLAMGNVKATAAGDSVKLDFAFNVKGYDLKAQTTDATSKQCSNSKDGQHIHFIMDNKPYVALYEPKHTTTVAKNTEHYVLCFLSRSYHESLKHKGASVIYHFKVDESGKLQKLEDPKGPVLFYSRPKGDYLGKDTENILLDFYVWNGMLGADHKVKADITTGGRDTSIIIPDWKSYSLKNLAMGKNTIRLTLVDAKGNKVEGPQSEVSRDFNLAKDEPMK